MMLSDEAPDYLPTQVIADALATREPAAGRQCLLIGPMASSMIC